MYPVSGSVGSATLLFGSVLAYIPTGSLCFDEIGKAFEHMDANRHLGKIVVTF